VQTVSQLLDKKGHEIWSVTPDASVYDAVKLMADKETGCLLVLDGSRVVGMISERDYTRKVILEGRASKDTAVSEIMSDRVVCASPEHTIEECMALMTDKRIRHLPVMDGDDLLGLVSIGDLVKAVIAEQQFEIEQLERYIAL
jgi:CBS domain-containing protein